MKAESSTMVAKNFSFRRLIVSDAVRLAPGILAELLGGFAISLILGRYLPAEAMGIFMLLWLAQTYAGALLTNWLRTAVIRFLPEDSTRLGAYLRLTLLTVAATAVLGILTAVLVERIWSEQINGPYLIWTILILCFVSAYTIFQSMLRGVFDQWRYSAGAVFLVVFKVILLLALLPNADDPAGTVLIVMALSYPPVLGWQAYRLYRLATFTDTGFRGRRESASSLAQRSLSYGFPLALSVLMLTILQSGDRYILARFVALEEVGVYAFWMSIGLQFGRGMYNLILMVLNPRLFQLHSVDPARARERIQDLAGLYIVVFAPLLAALGCLTPLVLSLLSVRSEYIDSSYLIFFGLSAAFVLGLSQLFGKTREFDAKTSAFIWAAMFGVFAMVGLSLAFIPIAGAPGAASASLAGLAVYFAIVARRSQSQPPLRDVLLGITSGFALITIYQVAAHQQIVAIGLFLMLGVAAIYAALVSSRLRQGRILSDA